jgi:hypothetical protein
MLVTNQDGLMIGRKQQMLDQVVPSEQEYGSAPVYRERTYPARVSGGYGERVQSSYADKRYYWGNDVWVTGGLVGKGPLVHPIAPTSASGGQVFRIIDGYNTAGNTLTQFVLSGTKVYRRNDDTNAGQAVDKDFSADSPVDAAVYQGGFAGATRSLYITTSAGALWERTPAGTWTACALPAGFLAYRLEVVGVELWAADTVNSVVRKVTSDPKVAGNWSGPFFVGDPSVKISAIRQTGQTLVIFKEDGTLFTLNSDGSVNDLFPGIAATPSPDNALRAQAWMNSLWFRSGQAFYRLEMPGAQLTPVGPGRLLDNASPVRGEPRVLAGWGGYVAFLGLYNALTQPDGTPPTSYLLSYGSWEEKNTDQGVQIVFDDQWDGSLAHWPNRVISAMAVSGASGQDRLYVGFMDGGWDWIKLVQNPLAAGSGAEFITGPSDIIFPLHHAMFQADLKHWLGFSVFGPVMRPGDEVTLSYRIMASAGAPGTDPTGGWIALGEFTGNGQRIETPPNMVGNALSLKASLSNTTTADTPVLEIVAFHERVVPAFKRDLQMTVDARGYQTRLDGGVLRFNSDQMHQWLLNFASQPGSLAIELPDETIDEIALFGYSERLLPPVAGGGRSWAIDIQATQFRILTVYGIISRFRGTRIGDMRGFAIGATRTM